MSDIKLFRYSKISCRLKNVSLIQTDYLCLTRWQECHKVDPNMCVSVFEDLQEKLLKLIFVGKYRIIQSYI